MDDGTSTTADERRRLLAELELERNQFIRNVETCRIRDIERTFIGQWSLKDIVGHVASWEAEVVTALRDLAFGRRPAILDFAEADLDRWNEDHVERKRSIHFWDLLDQLRASRHRLLETLAETPDEVLADEQSPERHLLLGIADHDRAHWHEIAARLAGMDGAARTGPTSVYEDMHPAAT